MSEVKRYGHISYLVEATPQILQLYPAMTVYVMASDFDAAKAELAAEKTASAGIFQQLEICQKQRDAARSELAALREELATTESMRKFFADAAVELDNRLTAAEQRNAELTSALVRARLWVEECRRFGDDGTIAEDWMMIMRTLKGHPHPPTEFDKPAESGASDKCTSDGGTCGLGGHCNKCPHTSLDPKIIGIEPMPPMEYDEP